MVKVHKASKLMVWEEITEVLLRHYGKHIIVGDADGLVAWEIMKDVRKHLGLSKVGAK